MGLSSGMKILEHPLEFEVQSTSACPGSLLADGRPTFRSLTSTSVNTPMPEEDDGDESYSNRE